MKKTKKLVSMLLAIVMMLTIIPMGTMTAFAVTDGNCYFCGHSLEAHKTTGDTAAIVGDTQVINSCSSCSEQSECVGKTWALALEGDNNPMNQPNVHKCSNTTATHYMIFTNGSYFKCKQYTFDSTREKWFVGSKLKSISNTLFPQGATAGDGKFYVEVLGKYEECESAPEWVATIITKVSAVADKLDSDGYTYAEMIATSGGSIENALNSLTDATYTQNGSVYTIKGYSDSDIIVEYVVTLDANENVTSVQVIFTDVEASTTYFDTTFTVPAGPTADFTASHFFCSVCKSAGKSFIANYSGDVQDHYMSAHEDDIIAAFDCTHECIPANPCGDKDCSNTPKQLGESATYWTLIDGVLTISGTGATPDYSYQNPVPWTDQRDNITSVVIENGVTTIGNYFVSGCSKVASVTISNSVTTIGEAAFMNCKALASITLPNNLTTIGTNAFNVTGLTSVSIPNTVTSIGNGAFSFCENLTSVTLPTGITKIESYTFARCGSLTSITIPNGVTSIGGSAFSLCGNLASVTIPSSVKSIGTYAFEECVKLDNVTLPEGVTSIGASAFTYCSGLTNVTIPSTVTTIAGAAFIGCSNLTEISLPSSVTTIDTNAFRQCSKLASVVVNATTVPTLGDNVFKDCSSDLVIYVPKESVTDYQTSWIAYENIIEAISTAPCGSCVLCGHGANNHSSMCYDCMMDNGPCVMTGEESFTPCVLDKGHTGVHSNYTGAIESGSATLTGNKKIDGPVIGSGVNSGATLYVDADGWTISVDDRFIITKIVVSGEGAIVYKNRVNEGCLGVEEGTPTYGNNTMTVDNVNATSITLIMVTDYNVGIGSITVFYDVATPTAPTTPEWVATIVSKVDAVASELVVEDSGTIALPDSLEELDASTFAELVDSLGDKEYSQADTVYTIEGNWNTEKMCINVTLDADENVASVNMTLADAGGVYTDLTFTPAPAGNLCPDFSAYDDTYYGHIYIMEIDSPIISLVFYDTQQDDPTRLVLGKAGAVLLEERYKNVNEENTWYHYDKATDKYYKCSTQGEGSHPAFHKKFTLNYTGIQWLYGGAVPVYEGDKVYTAIADDGNECYAYNDGKKLEYGNGFTSVIVKIDGNSIYFCSDHTGDYGTFCDNCTPPCGLCTECGHPWAKHDPVGDCCSLCPVGDGCFDEILGEQCVLKSGHDGEHDSWYTVTDTDDINAILTKVAGEFKDAEEPDNYGIEISGNATDGFSYVINFAGSKLNATLVAVKQKGTEYYIEVKNVSEGVGAGYTFNFNSQGKLTGCYQAGYDDYHAYPYIHVHTWDNGTCTLDGTTCSHTNMTTSDATCGTCGITNPNYVPSHTHTYDTAWSTDATQHWHAATCEHTSEKSSLGNHSGGTATCTTQATCSNCGASYGNLANHSYTTKASTQKASDATCTAAATYYVQCDNCTSVSTTATVSVGTANGHSYTTKASTQKASDATCTAAATYYVQCDNCTSVSTTATVSVGTANAHSYTTKASTQKASDATCTAAATYYVQCDNCTSVSTTATVSVGTANGHSFASTYSSDETGHWYAATCGHSSEKSGFATHRSSGPATEEAAEVCLDCGYEIAAKLSSKGKVISVSLANAPKHSHYKCTDTIVPEIDVEGDVNYTVKFTTSNPDLLKVDENGNICGARKWWHKTATVTCTVTDEYGNVVSDTCDIKCGFVWWQYPIGIVCWTIDAIISLF